MEIKERYNIDDLITVMAKLRDPNGGCPWDLEQDFASIAPYTIEEAYEVAEAIDQGDMTNLREELGDLLLQPIYHAQMAREAGHFNISDVVHDITAKMIHRHPHVFGDGEAHTADDVNAIWDTRKKMEAGKEQSASALDGVPLGFPSLLRAQKLQKKAAKVGFEWPSSDDVLDKLDEELRELREASNAAERLDEFGDIMFVLANYARMNGINAEEALRQCNAKFSRRFKGMESDFEAEGKVMSDASLDQMTQMWVKQKQKER
ncbi:MAG: nucleoside triphosphate pyrophosphohydrolase [Alphaproteobacteria bacterium]